MSDELFEVIYHDDDDSANTFVTPSLTPPPSPKRRPSRVKNASVDYWPQKPIVRSPKTWGERHAAYLELSACIDAINSRAGKSV